MKMSWKLFGTTLFLILLITILPFKIPQFEDIESRSPKVLELIRSTKSTEKELEFVDKTVKKNVLLVAYWRTGSTYFGQLLGHYPKTYYSYEPIHTFSNRVSLTKSLAFMTLIVICIHFRKISGEITAKNKLSN